MLKRNGDLDTPLLYRALKNANSSLDAWTQFVWKNKAPPRVKFFAWLLSQERIQCKTVLRKKNTVESIVCEVCQAEETPAHIIFGCPNAKQFWDALQIQMDANWPIQALREIQAPPHVAAKYC